MALTCGSGDVCGNCAREQGGIFPPKFFCFNFTAAAVVRLFLVTLIYGRLLNMHEELTAALCFSALAGRAGAKFSGM